MSDIIPQNNGEQARPYSEPEAAELQPGVEVECEIHALAGGGKGVARIGGMVVFVERALPGQRVRALLLRRKKRFAEAVALDVVRQASDEIAPPCPHFGDCGGCDWQHLDYPSQLHWKRRLTLEALERIGGVEDLDSIVQDTMASPLQYGYRNKMEFAFAADEGGGLLLGLRQRSSHEVLDVSTCLLPGAEMVEIMQAARNLCADSGLEAWDPKSRTGFWRFLVLRSLLPDAAEDGDGERILAQFITYGRGPTEVLETIAQELMERYPRLAGVVHGGRKAPAQVAMAEEVLAVYGDDALETALQDPESGERFIYRVSAGAFFQTNTEAAAKLFSLVRTLAAVRQGETVWDVYSGGGGAGLWLARDAGMLLGFDGTPEAVADAGRNAARNALGNCVFRTGDVRRLLQTEREDPDVVILDPPRTGLHQEVTDELLKRTPRRIVYISCNPATQARDVGRLLDAYTVEAVYPVDMFPQGHHVESVAVLQKREQA